MTLKFWEYQLTTRIGNRRGAICLGERIKKGTYRSTITTIPYSQITGALCAALHFSGEQAAQIHAVGKFTNLNPLEDHLTTITVSNRQRVSGAAQIPVDVTALVDVEGAVFIESNEATKDWNTTQSTIIVKMGAYRNKGLGRCQLKYTRQIEFDPNDAKRGLLVTRIPEAQLARFGVTVDKPVYGFLFQPDDTYTTGKYVRSIFEKSIVAGPGFLLE